MSSRDAKTLKGLKPDQYARQGVHKPKNIPARGDHAGAPSQPSKFSSVGGKSVRKGVGQDSTVTVDMKPDEIHRSSLTTPGSVRTDRYTGPGRTRGDPVRFGVPQLKKG